MPDGIILKGVGGFYDVLDQKDYRSVYSCKVRGVFRKTGELTPLPGDRVVFKILNENKKEGHIEKIIDRRNSFVRPPVANIDQLAIVVAVNSPEPDLMLVDKLIISCQVKEIQPLIVINKIDLDEGGTAEKLKRIYGPTGFPIILLSKYRKESYDNLHEKLIGYTTAFAGQSGVGKSTILNMIMDNWLMETGDVSEKIKRGKHTTRHVQLFRLDQGGFILDTPGFSSYSLSDVDHQTLDTFYPDFKEGLGLCRFKGCSHTSEPGCAVKELYSQGKIDEGRYYRYVELYGELKEIYDNRYRR